VLVVADQPADVERDHEVDDGVAAPLGEAAALDLHPPLGLHGADLVVVELAVAAVVQRDAADERLERQRLRQPPHRRDRAGHPPMLGLRHDDAAGRPEHQTLAASRSYGLRV
jgi:hypothetical protein